MIVNIIKKFQSKRRKYEEQSEVNYMQAPNHGMASFEIQISYQL